MKRIELSRSLPVNTVALELLLKACVVPSHVGGARLEPGSHVDLQLYSGRTFDTVTQAVSIENYGDALSLDYQRWTVACAILEAAERFISQEHEPALQQYLLVVGSLRALAYETYDASLILDAYLLRSLAVAGYAPSLTNCSICNAPGPHKFFSLVGGGSVCDNCKPSAAPTPHPESLELMQELLSGDWESAVESELRYRREASGIDCCVFAVASRTWSSKSAIS